MASGLGWKRNEDEVLERRRQFFSRQLPDGILASLPVKVDTDREWRVFKAKWGWERYRDGEERPFPSNEEIFERMQIGLAERGKVTDDSLPVAYSTLDGGDDAVRGLFGRPIRFFHRPGATYSAAPPLLADYSRLDTLEFSLQSPWVRRMLDIQEYFEKHAAGRFAQHPSLTMDAMNFAMMMRGNTECYGDLYSAPSELRRLFEIGLDFNVRYQQAQFSRIGGYRDGCFVWIAGWVPFPRAISLSVDAYVLCSARHYVEFGLEYQARLIRHFGCGLMHFHCNRADLAAKVARLPGLQLFQYGAGLPTGPADHTFLNEMRRAVGDIPILTGYPLDEFLKGLADRTLPGNVWYGVRAVPLSADQANRLMDQVRAYRAKGD